MTRDPSKIITGSDPRCDPFLQNIHLANHLGEQSRDNCCQQSSQAIHLENPHLSSAELKDLLRPPAQQRALAQIIG